MADRAMGTPCTSCGRMVACSGADHATVLHGICGDCGAHVSIRNYNIVRGVAVPVPEDDALVLPDEAVVGEEDVTKGFEVPVKLYTSTPTVDPNEAPL